MNRFASVVLGLLLLAAAGCSRSPASMGYKPAPPLVTVAKAISRDVPHYLDEIGTCAALQYVSVIPQVTGPITQIHFKDGADLHKGELLFNIDPRPYQAALDQAQANLQQSQAALEFAQIEFDRYQRLIGTKAISQDDFDTKKNAMDVAVAQLAASKAAVETARLNLRYCTIDSPIDGRAGEHLVDVGNVVTANQTSLLVVQGLNPIYADFTCDESELPAIRQYAAKGLLKVLVKLPGDSGQGHEGNLTFIDTQVQNQAGRVKLRATLPNADRHFWPGQFIDVRLILNVEKNAVLIPVAAMQVGQNGSFVYVIGKNATAQLQPVTLGQRQDNLVVVEKGVQAGQEVITNGQLSVVPGNPVRIEAPASAPATAGAAETAGAAS